MRQTCYSGLGFCPAIPQQAGKEFSNVSNGGMIITTGGALLAGTLASLGLFLYIVATEKYEKRV